ncbi:MAG: Rpp14/Pop5 family protein [Candidatus Bathyarchaeia archaeon]
MPVRGTGRRYLAFSIDGGDDYSEQEISDALYNAVRELFGDYGVSGLRPKLIEYDEEKREGIVRCSRSNTREMRAAMALITEISNREAAVRVMGASGTIKSLKAAISGR